MGWLWLRAPGGRPGRGLYRLGTLLRGQAQLLWGDRRRRTKAGRRWRSRGTSKTRTPDRLLPAGGSPTRGSNERCGRSARRPLRRAGRSRPPRSAGVPAPVAWRVTSTDTRRSPSATGLSSDPIPGIACCGRAADSTRSTRATPEPTTTLPGGAVSDRPADDTDQSAASTTSRTPAAAAAARSSRRCGRASSGRRRGPCWSCLDRGRTTAALIGGSPGSPRRGRRPGRRACPGPRCNAGAGCRRASRSFPTAPRSTSTVVSSRPSVVVSTARHVAVEASQYWARTRVPRIVDRSEAEMPRDTAARISTGTATVAVTSTVGRVPTGADATSRNWPSSEAVWAAPPRGVPPVVTDHAVGDRSALFPVQGRSRTPRPRVRCCPPGRRRPPSAPGPSRS